MPIELLLGRSAAMCVHPFAAWLRLTVRGRTLLVSAYFGASYAIVLAILLVS